MNIEKKDLSNNQLFLSVVGLEKKQQIHHNNIENHLVLRVLTKVNALFF